MLIINNIVFDLSGNDFLEPYLRRELHAEEPDGNDAPPVTAALKIITDATEGATDKAFMAYADSNMLPVAVLRCPNIVGTGMNGFMHRIAAGIYKGTFVHIAGNEARVSVVHAVDVARAAVVAAGIQGTYTLTDGTDPTIHDIAEALAYRIGDKRIIAIKPSWAKLWYGKRYFQQLTTNATTPSTFTEVFPDFHPVVVTEYLHTHVYDEESL